MTLVRLSKLEKKTPNTKKRASWKGRVRESPPLIIRGNDTACGAERFKNGFEKFPG